MAVAIDQPRFRAIVISSTGNGATVIDGLESFHTEKSDNGDAGTWSFTAPLSDPAVNFLATTIGPNDIVALFADRVTSTVPTNFLGGDWNTDSLTWGSAGASVTEQFANTPSCIMVGMVDLPDEGVDFEHNSGVLQVQGRDLTKIFIDNDTYVPFTELSGEKAFSSVNNAVIRYDMSGHIMLKNVLNVFVKKDAFVTAALNAGGSALDTAFVTPDDEQTRAASYGYPWDQFVSQVNINDPSFLHIPAPYTLPNFAVQAGSAWPNILELRNYPMTRLFVQENGRLLFDYAWDAWGLNGADSDVKNPVVATITADDVRQQNFWQNDADYVSVMTALPTQIPAGTTKVSDLWQPETSYSGATSEITRFGYRWQQWRSQYDDPSYPNYIQNLQIKLNVLFQMHNNLSFGRITVKGNPALRAGQRVLFNYNDPASTKRLWGPKSSVIAATIANGMQSWYITGVSHDGQYSSDYRTTIEVRYPMAPSVQVAFA